jgi:hypothetical protein
VYRKQAGDEFVVASGGTLTIESGGQLAFGTAAVSATGATLTVTATNVGFTRFSNSDRFSSIFSTFPLPPLE